MGKQPNHQEKYSVKEHYTRARIIRTTKDTDERISEIALLDLENRGEQGTINIQVNPAEEFQAILGFGGAFTEAGGYVLGKLDPAKRQEVIDAYFSPVSGLHYNLGRVHMNSCDFSLGNYSCDDTDGDIELKDFNINRDRQYLIPLIKEAARSAGAPIELLVSPWSPPAWMKTNGAMNGGGQLKAEYRETWARFFVKFIRAYEQEGIPVWAVSVQNEPLAAQTWDSCLYSAEEEGAFVRDYLGPQLQQHGYSDKKILIWDHNRDLIYERAQAVLADPETAKYVWGIGFHWYSGDQFENVAQTYRHFPEKALIFTEGCIEKGVKLGQWDRGEIYAYNMIGDFRSGAAGWIDWNLVLDQNGGPNHVGNYCDAPVVADLETGQVFYQSSYYYIGHFSKFIDRGARRIGCNSAGDLDTVAFCNSAGRIVVIVLNRQDDDRTFTLEVPGTSVTLASPKHSIQTIILE